MKKILLLEPDKEQAELLSGWLKGESYNVSTIDKIQEVQSFLSNEKFDILLMDIDELETIELSLKLVQTLKKDTHFSDLAIAILTYKKGAGKITAAIEAGVDSFILKPFETSSFLKHIETIFKEIEFKSKGKKVLDLNYINYLIVLAGQMERDGFFALSTVIFNKLIIERINTILGPPVIMQIIKRANEAIGMDYEFMKEIKFSDSKILMNDMDNVSKNIPVAKLTAAFRDYIYAFLQLVRTLTSDILMERE